MEKERVKHCPYCGEEILAVAQKCKHCGKWLKIEKQPCPVCLNEVDISDEVCPYCKTTLLHLSTSGGKLAVAMQQNGKTVPVFLFHQVNTVGTASFVLSIISLLISLFTYIAFLVECIAIWCSIAGLQKQPKGLAIAGICLSCLSIIITIASIVAIGEGYFHMEDLCDIVARAF